MLRTLKQFVPNPRHGVKDTNTYVYSIMRIILLLLCDNHIRVPSNYWLMNLMRTNMTLIDQIHILTIDN